ncbi:TonB family protein [Pseudomonas sp. NA-150]|uniref:energy transducer TonB n=1 Tax=Pseudomonas sp. NA-150 TaxID=3367525 RepID=UPI0037C7E782
MITSRQKLTRYSGSLLLVLAVHAAAILVALRWSAPQIIELPPLAMMVELAPLPEPAPPPPPRVVQAPPPPAPVEEMPLPKLVEAPKPVIAIPKPEKPKVKPQPPQPEKKPELPKEKPVESKPVDTPPTPAEPVKSSAPPQTSSPPTVSNAVPNWQSELLRHLAKYKRYPEDARRRGIQGSVRLRFVVDAEGKVLSFSLASNSGNASLDRATLEMISRAQPLPKPPAESLTNGTVELVAPFNYSLDKR